MFGNPQFDRVRQVFADQFQPDGSGALYRKGMKGPPIRVSLLERDRFIKTFNKRLQYSTWAIFPATLLLIGLLVVLVPDVDSPIAQVATYAGLALIILPFSAAYYWAWNAPSRELEGRSPEGLALSKDEVRQLKFSRMTYGQLGTAVLMAFALVWKVSAKTDVLHGWGILWLVFAGLLIGAAGVQAFRKWRFERSSAC